MDVRCQCSSVIFKTPLPEPLALYICHCGECRRQTGSAFGASAIFPQFKLPETERLSCYRLIHMTPTQNVVSVKAGCIEGLDWSNAIHLWTKSAMVPIPESSEAHRECTAKDPEEKEAKKEVKEEEEKEEEEKEEESASAAADYGNSQELLDQPDCLVGGGMYKVRG